MRIKLTTIICLFSALLLTTACVSEDYTTDICDNNTETMQIMFTLSMSGTKTRAATWGDQYDDETASVWENSIAQGQLQVLLYDNSNELMGEVENLTYVRHTGTDNNVYDIVGDITVDVIDDNTTINGKLVVLANYATTVSTKKGDDLSVIKEQTFSNEGINKQTKYIPMWGVHTLNNLQMEKGVRSDAGIIYMLRSVAKIRVLLDDATAEKYTLAVPSLSDYNISGYCEPSNFDAVAETTALGYESSSTETDYKTSFHPNATSSATNLSFNTISENKSYVVYVPEYAYDTENSKPTISVVLTPKEGTLGGTINTTIQFKDYDAEGNPTGNGHDIVRNTIYEYTLTKTDEEDLKLKYQAMDWTESSNEVVFW